MANIKLSLVGFLCALCFVGFSQDTAVAVEPIIEPAKQFSPTLQEGPRLNTERPQSIRQERVPFSQRPKNPKVAGWLSTVLPGAGQVYNGQWWKVPVIYGGAGALIYIGNFNNTERKIFQKELRNRLNLSGIQEPNSEDSVRFSLNPDLRMWNINQIESARNYYRRNLELVYVFSGLLYLLNIVDAVVFAHLATFDVSDNLTMHVQPFASPDLSYHALVNQRVPMQGGLRLTFTLK